MFSKDTCVKSARSELLRRRRGLAVASAEPAQLDGGLVTGDTPNEIIQTIVGNIPAGIALIDGRSLRAKWANQAYCQFLDEPYRTLENITGLRVEDFMPEAEESGLLKALEQVVQTRQPQTDTEYKQHSGRRGVTYWRCTLLPIGGENDVPDVLILATEITQQVLRRQAETDARVRMAKLALEAQQEAYAREAELRRTNEALEAEIAVRRQVEEELRTSQEQLQTYSRRLVEATENERRTIARELHDEAGQSLTALKLDLQRLQSTECCPNAGPQMAELIQLTDSIMDGLHRLSSNLRPPSLDRLGLAPALRQYLDSFMRTSGVEAEFLAIGLNDQRMSYEIETALYRMTQEALTNVARHAQATSVGVIVERQGDQVSLIVEDNGRGFDLEEAMRRSRLGLLGLRERAEMLGGTLTIEATPGQGTTVFVTLPYCDQSPE